MWQYATFTVSNPAVALGAPWSTVNSANIPGPSNATGGWYLYPTPTYGTTTIDCLDTGYYRTYVFVYYPSVGMIAVGHD